MKLLYYHWFNFSLSEKPNHASLKLFKASKMLKNDHDFSFYFEKGLSFPFFSKENFSMTKRKSVINFILTSNNLGEVKIYQNLFLIKLFFSYKNSLYLSSPYVWGMSYSSSNVKFCFQRYAFLNKLFFVQISKNCNHQTSFHDCPNLGSLTLI